MLVLFFLLLAVACFFCLTRDNNIFPFIVLVGFFQDPARKLAAGEPVIMTIMVAAVIGCVTLRKLAVSPGSLSEPYTRWAQSIALPLSVYLVLVALQFVHSLVRYDSVLLPALGSIFYLAPLIAISIGYSQFPQFQDIRSFFKLFSAMAILVAVTIVLSFNGVSSDIFGEVGSGLMIYDQGTVLRAYSGLMRSSEISGWHMGAGVCFLIILLVDKDSLPATLLTAGLAILLIAAIVLTGRRKMIAQIAIFAAIYLPVLRYYQGRLAIRYFVGILVAVAGGWFVFEIFLSSNSGTDFDLYLRRGTSVFGDAGGRFEQLGIGSIGWAMQRFGIFGGGLGVAAQGAQHFVQIGGSGAGEGGLGKIVSELGLVSLFFIAWLLIAIGGYLNRCIKLVARAVPHKLPIVTGVFCFLLANTPTFIVASQVYGDVFVLLVLGLLLGFLFATPSQLVSEVEQLQNRAKSRAY